MPLKYKMCLSKKYLVHHTPWQCKFTLGELENVSGYLVHCWLYRYIFCVSNIDQG